MSSIQQIFSLTDLEALKALQIYIRHFVDGIISGMHQSPRKGFGIEFKEYKNYTPGDSLKQLDWKYFARTDHYMIKEAEVERQHDFIFVLDRSKSMQFKGKEASKYDISRAFIASLSYLAKQQHDSYQLFNAKSNARNFDTFLYELIKQETDVSFEFTEMLPDKKQSSRTTAFIISDGYLTDDELEKLLKSWSYASQKTVFVHLLFENEMKLNFEKENYRFKDLESGRTVQINTKEARMEYQHQLNNWHRGIKNLCAKNEIMYFQLEDIKPLEHDIIQLLTLMNFNLK
ncbi:DUF58 domain-containing protein [Marivirga sp. S37H4]|uniref:DUF58 domain-containing protein n=1 Tax=Marivirga aurantiaca TaxID=2802615 RepID=A0A935CDZ1_9BACT|nr:DUF58 domain-containing protein [Marivirga aurantiaca]MBK6267418.1 DUF58 domain-containing protein [Marivirga aurantiaca]